MQADIANSKIAARMSQEAREESRRLKHLPIVAMLRGPRRDEVVASAKAEIRRWRAERLCSQDYIVAWENLLEDPARVAEVLEDRSPLSQRLRQNSPFAFYIAP